MDIIITGDFNINLLHYDDHSETAEFLSMMLSFEYIPLISLPTRITSHSCTLIDNILIIQNHTRTNTYLEICSQKLVTI